MGTARVEEAMIEEITRMGIRAAILLRGVILQTVDRETLEWGLREIAAASLMEKYVDRILGHPECIHLFNLLALVFSLEGQLDYQIQEYGMDSLKDDLEEINASLRQIGEQFDLPPVGTVVCG